MATILSNLDQLVLGYLYERGYVGTARSLEREAHLEECVKGSEEVRFLRACILDGRWASALHFIAPMRESEHLCQWPEVFPAMKRCLLRAQFFELLGNGFNDAFEIVDDGGVTDDEAIGETGDGADADSGIIGACSERGVSSPRLVSQLVSVLTRLRELSSVSDSDFERLCFLLSHPSPQTADEPPHTEFDDWTVAIGRERCFVEIVPLFSRALTGKADVNVDVLDWPYVVSRGHLMHLCGASSVDEQNKEEEARQRVEQARAERIRAERLQSEEKARIEGDREKREEHKIATVAAEGDTPLCSSVVRLASATRSSQRLAANADETDSGLRAAMETARERTRVALQERQQQLQQNEDEEEEEKEREQLYNTLAAVAPATSARWSESRSLLSRPFHCCGVLRDAQPVRCVSFSHNGTHLAVGANSRSLRVCAVPDSSASDEPLTVLAKRDKYHDGSVYCAAWSGSGRLIASGSNDKSVRVARVGYTSGVDANELCVDAEREMWVHDGTVRDVVFVKGDEMVVSGGAGDCAVRTSDVGRGTCVSVFKGHSDHVSSVLASPSHSVLSGALDGTVREWDLRSETCVRVFDLQRDSPLGAVLACDVDAHTKWLAVSGNDAASYSGSGGAGGVHLFDYANGSYVRSLDVHSSDVRSVRFSPDSKWLLTASYDGSVCLTDMATFESSIVATHSGKIVQARWHPEGTMFATSSADKTARVWSVV